MITEAEVFAALELLPAHSWLRVYAYFAATQVDSHAMFHVGIGLATLSVTCPHSLTARGFGVKADTYPNFYTWVVGPSGKAEKSLAIDVGASLLRDFTDDLVGPLPTADTVLLKVLSIKPCQLFLYSEGGRFLATTGGVGNQQGQALRKGYTECFDGKPVSLAYSIDKGRSSFSVEAPRPSFVGGCTPTDLEDFTLGVDWTGGFMSRFFFAYGEPERRQDEPLVQPEVRTWLGSWLARSAVQGNPGKCLGMDASAKAHYNAWRDAYVLYYEDQARDATLAGVLNRGRLMSVKIAMLICWSCGRGWDGETWWISEVEMRAATALVDLHLRCAVALAADIQPSVPMREQHQLYRAIGTAWTAHGEVLRAAKLTERQAKPYFATLLLQGRIAETTQGATLYYRRVEGGTARPYDNDFVFTPPLSVGES